METKKARASADAHETPISSLFKGKSGRHIFGSYSYVKYQYRGGFKQDLSSEEKVSLEHQQRRIIRLRSRLEQHAGSSSLFAQLRADRHAWKFQNSGLRGGENSKRNVRVATLAPEELDPDDPGKSPPEPDDGSDQVEREIRAGVMHFRDNGAFEWTGFDYEGPFAERYLGHFPDQKMSIHDLLHDREHNPFTAYKNDIKWFHFPVNHVQWVQVRQRSPASSAQLRVS